MEVTITVSEKSSTVEVYVVHRIHGSLMSLVSSAEGSVWRPLRTDLASSMPLFSISTETARALRDALNTQLPESPYAYKKECDTPSTPSQGVGETLCGAGAASAEVRLIPPFRLSAASTLYALYTPEDIYAKAARTILEDIQSAQKEDKPSTAKPKVDPAVFAAACHLVASLTEMSHPPPSLGEQVRQAKYAKHLLASILKLAGYEDA